MLTNEQAAEQAARMSNQELENAIGSIGASPDHTALGLAAVNVKMGRTQAAEAEAQRLAPIEAARRQARYAWEQAGAVGDFDAFFAQRQRQEANARLDAERARASYIYGRMF